MPEFAIKFIDFNYLEIFSGLFRMCQNFYTKDIKKTMLDYLNLCCQIEIIDYSFIVSSHLFYLKNSYYRIPHDQKSNIKIDNFEVKKKASYIRDLKQITFPLSLILRSPIIFKKLLHSFFLEL